MTEMSPLGRRMIEDMTVRNLAPATQRSYVHAVAKFGRFFGRSPDKLDQRIPYAREPQKLPAVLGADEVVCCLEAVPSLKSRAALTTAVQRRSRWMSHCLA